MIVELTPEERFQVIESYDQIHEIMRRILALENDEGRKRDHLWVVGFKAMDYIRFIEMAMFGPFTAKTISPRRIFQMAVTLDCSRLLIVTNQQGNKPKVSKGDVAITSRLMAAGDLMDLDVMDQLVITPENGYLSIIHQKGDSPFSK